MQNEEIIISILTHNKLEFTKRCIDRILKNTISPYYRIVVTDNCSTDGTRLWLERLGNKIRLIKNNENVGFSKAHNAVMRAYRNNDIVLMNNDIEVPTKWLLTLHEEAYFRDYGAVSPAIVTSRGLDVGAVLDSNARGKSLIDDFETEPDWITGSCLYLKSETIEKNGYLDDNFNFYYEDVDYCLRMKQAGIKFKCIKEVAVIHHNSVSSNPDQKRMMLEQSRQYIASKYSERFTA